MAGLEGVHCTSVISTQSGTSEGPCSPLSIIGRLSSLGGGGGGGGNNREVDTWGLEVRVFSFIQHVLDRRFHCSNLSYNNALINST